MKFPALLLLLATACGPAETPPEAAVAVRDTALTAAAQTDTPLPAAPVVAPVSVEKTSPAVRTKPSEPIQEETQPPVPAPTPEKAPEQPEAPDHSAWNSLLQKYVSASGKVDYAGFKKDELALKAYLSLLAANPPLPSWPKAEKMAYWINAYNAFTIQLILDHYPVKSILDIRNGKPWDWAWIKLGEKTNTLNQIENDILRPQFGDARIHFAVNCAAKSCPPLANKAFTAANLEGLLEQQTKKFINNPAFNTLSGNPVRVSKIFEWYASDFGALPAFLNRYATTLLPEGAQVVFEEYDWKLNE